MSRIVLGVEYDGSDFFGFQKQKTSTNTVQYQLETALSKVAKEAITLVCAGRTDSGVHAHEQVVHFDTSVERPDKAWIRGVNTQLPHAVRVHWCKRVEPNFHARFSAFSRTYRYILYSSKVAPTTLRNQVTWTPYELDWELMQTAALNLEGTHDFSAFRASGCQASNPTRTVEYARLSRHGCFWVFEIRANAFLQHMVRNIVGSLLEIGKGKQSSSWISELLSLGDRTKAGSTAPPYGLYFVSADFGKSFELPQRAPGPLFIT